MSCSLTKDLSPKTYNNTCVLALSARDDVKGIFSDCCVNKTVPVIKTDCYEYCNTTIPDIQICVGFGVQALTPSTTLKQEDMACFLSGQGTDSGSDSNSTSSASGSASASQSAASTSTETSSKASSTGTASSTTSSPSASSTKASKAAGAGSVSLGAMAVVGLVVFGLLV